MARKIASTIAKNVPLRDIVKMRLAGHTLDQIGDHFGVSHQNISHRLNGALGVLDGDRLNAYRTNRIAILEQIEEKMLGEICNPARMAKATVGNVAYAFTQVHTARRLESGQSTANISLRGIVEALGSEARKPAVDKVSNAPVELTPANTDTSNLT